MRTMARPDNRGVAILLVIAVLAGLMALAAPFVLSMVQHGRASRSDLHAMQARLGAEAAQSHALAQLYKNTIKFDLQSGEPEVTTLFDLRVLMDFPAASKEFDKYGINVQNPAGLIWSAKVEDEQAKVNLNSATPALIGNLLGSAILVETAQKGISELIVDDAKQFPARGGLVSLIGERTALEYIAVQGNRIVLKNPTTLAHFEGALVFDGRAQKIADYKYSRGGNAFLPFRSVYEIKLPLAPTAAESLNPDEFARIERSLTTQSGLNGPMWGHGERPREQGAGVAFGFNVENGDGFTPGALIRVVENGFATNYARVRRVVPHRQGDGAYVELDDGIGLGDPQDYTRFIQPQLRHPININTAPQSVVEACFMGVCIYSGKEAIRRQTAQMLAEFMLNSGNIYKTPQDLKKVLDEAHTRGILTSQQRDAVYINATEPGSPKLRTATVPFCFHSFGSYTIEGSGVVNSENGIQFARNTTRQLVTLPTPWPGRFKVEWQAGFQNLLDQGLGKRVVTFPYPMGQSKFKRQSTVKLPAPNMGNIRLDVGQTGPHDMPGEFLDHCDTETEAGYRQDGYDMRKRGPFIIPLNGNAGSRTGNNPLAPGQNPTLVVGGNNNNQNQNQNNQTTNPANPTQTACRPTAVELWYRPLSGGQSVFFDESLEDDRNRVTFSYEPSHPIKPGLLVQIFDAGLECQDISPKEWQHLQRKPVEFLYPAQLDSGEWYHIAASWKTGGINGQDIRLDAQPVPFREQIHFRPGARLASGIGIDDDTLELEPDDPDFEKHFPKNGGAIQIGEEIIEYRLRQGGSFQQCQRGTRLSTAQKHDTGELAVPYGYSIGVGQDIAVGGAVLTENVERPSVMRNCRVQLPPTSQINFVLDTETTKIPVSDATDLPPTGFVTVGNELIYYGKRTATALLQIQRAQRSNFGVPARNIRDGAAVRLASIEISDISQYDDSGIVQIDDDQNDKIVEWIAYGSKQSINGKHYLVAVLGGDGSIRYQINNPPVTKDGPGLRIDDFRNKFGIPTNTAANRDSAHAKKAKVIPVFRMNGPHCGNQRSPYGDLGVSEVSVIERGTTHADLMYVKQAYIDQWPNWRWIGPNGSCPAVWVDWGLHYYVGLNDFVSRRYPRQATRITKWPSGELPDTIGAKRIVGADRNGEGQLKGHVDEVKVNTFNTLGGRIAMTMAGTGINGGDEEILIEDHHSWPVPGSGGSSNLNWPATGGLIRIENELIFYKTMSTTTIQYYSDVLPEMKQKAERMVRNPCPPNVMENQPNIETKTVVLLRGCRRGVLGTESDAHPVGAKAMLLDGMAVSLLRGALHGSSDTFNVADARGFAPEGYVWIGNEAISYLERNGNSFKGCQYFRGRFGTSQGEHDADEIVRSLPFRYWDREGKLYDGDGLAYIQAGYAATDAIWDGVELQVTGTEERPAPPPRVKPRVLLRFDQRPTWDMNPTNTVGGLYEIRGKTGVIPLRGTTKSDGVRADQIEMRVYWEYLSGAFVPNHDWKRTFSIEKMRATYSTPLIMRRLDEVEKR